MLRYLSILSVLCAFGASVYAVVARPQRVDPLSSESYGEDLRAMLALQIELNAEVMKVRSGFAGSYDGLVRIEAELKSLGRRMLAPPRFLPRFAQRELHDAVRTLEQKRHDTARIVERFKSESAVLRNSLRFLPIAASEIDALSQTTQAGAAYKEAAGALVRDVLLLNNFGDEAILARVSAGLDALTQRLRSDDELELVLLHARIVREKAPAVAALALAILSSGTWLAVRRANETCPGFASGSHFPRRSAAA